MLDVFRILFFRDRTLRVQDVLRKTFTAQQQIFSLILGDWEEIFEGAYPEEGGHSYQPKRRNFVGGVIVFFLFVFFFQNFGINRFVAMQWKFFLNHPVFKEYCP